MIEKNKPISILTAEELMEVLETVLRKFMNTANSMDSLPQNRVYGIHGIEKLFNVSHKTAQHYKDTFLKPAVMQNGRKIVVDADMAMKLFKEHQKTD